ncbi:Usher syndrome type-1C protein-binding protein 1 [Lacerta agilis]|uniref:Usher syndrome type-1C protein-binding protein 1 n=1 Tax=Lacerta agilis TaxID=80427 RepID=UPI00141A47BA|nr:Usher syndrome type-1C protein-binding protein 1 [Lacerta agilis]
MDKGDEDPAGERFGGDAPDEGSILRYEEHITGLLVTITRLHGRIESLQRSKAREDDDLCSDLCSEYTASLPRCSLPFPNPAAALPPPAAHPERGDLFLDVHKAVTSLENTVLAHRCRLPSASAELEGCTEPMEGLEEILQRFQGGKKDPWPRPDPEAQTSVAGFLADGMSIYEREIALYEERNASLREELEGKDGELERSKAALCTYQEERDKLQRKVKDLQGALSEMEAHPYGATSPVREKESLGFQDPLVAAQNFACCFRGAPSAHPVCCLHPAQGPPPMETPTKGMEDQRQELHGFTEKLQGLNQLLSATLQESKGDMEGISLLLGQRESEETALRLAVRYSERCLEAYEVLLSLTPTKLHPETEAGGEEGSLCHAGRLSEVKSAVLGEAYRSLRRCGKDVSGGPGLSCWEQRCGRGRLSELYRSEEGDRKVLRGYIRRLREEQSSLKLPPCRPPPGPDSAAARISSRIGTKVAEVQKASQDTLPSEAAQPRMEKTRLLQELQEAREALGDLNTRLHLTEKEKRRLALQMYAFRAQEAACLLMARILEGERDELRGQQTASTGSSSSSSSGEDSLEDFAPICTSQRNAPRPSEDAGVEQSGEDAKREASKFLDTLTHVNGRIVELKDRISSLLAELEERSQDSRTQEAQQMELTRDFFKAHSALVLAYQNGRKKQEAQLHQLETQIGLMGQRQAGQLQSLVRTLRRLEGRAGSPAST